MSNFNKIIKKPQHGFDIKEFELLWKNNDYADYVTDDLVMFFNKYYKETP